MQEKSAKELYQQWREAANELQKLREELGFVFKELREGEDIESPPKALTPETIEQLRQLEKKVDDLWKAYRERSMYP